MRPRNILVILLFLLLTTLCFAQQEWVSRYDVYTGYSFLQTPKLGLFENGFNGEFGVNVKPWVALGGDFSIFTGNSHVVPDQLSTKVQGDLLPALQQIWQIDPTYKFIAPYDATTYTFSAGPQINFRQMKAITFFVRPALGALHQTVKVNTSNPFTQQLVTGLLGPTMKKDDTVVFYGFGGGMDFNLSKRIGVRTAADYVHYDLFSGTLNGAENTVRFSIGPTFRFGPNIVKK